MFESDNQEKINTHTQIIVNENDVQNGGQQNDVGAFKVLVYY